MLWCITAEVVVGDVFGLHAEAVEQLDRVATHGGGAVHVVFDILGAGPVEGQVEVKVWEVAPGAVGSAADAELAVETAHQYFVTGME